MGRKIMSDQMDEVFPPMFEIEPASTPGADDAINSVDARLIWDLVSNIRTPEKVLESYGLTITDLKAKAANALFSSAYREAERVWKSDMNIKTRIQLKASFLLEDSLMTLFNIIRQEGIGVNAKLEAIEQLTKISTVTNVPKENGTTEKHNITINIGGSAPPIKVTAETYNGSASLSTT
jgi:hypothetical protein